jgi:2-succinyl-6-hydroxy-2,4-cyclohexadiene-1-carboxylate synthase
MTESTLLLHGFTGSSSSWGRVLTAIRTLGGEVSALDLPGHGARGGEPGPGTSSLASTLTEVDESLSSEGGEQALVGYSMGGRIALHYAHRNPGRLDRLVLESASPGLASEEERAQRIAADEELADALEREGLEAFVDRWEALPLFATQRALPESIREELRERRLLGRATGLAWALRVLGTGRLPSLWDALSGIDVPTLVLVGGLDAKFLEIGERMAEQLPRASLHVVPDAGHAIHLERPDAWAQAVGDFLGGSIVPDHD